MTEEDLLRRLQDCERRCEGGRQSAMRNAADMLHRETAGRGDRQTRDLLHRVLCSLSDGSMRELDEAIRRVGSYLDHQMSKRHDYMRAYGASPATIRDRSGITQAFDLLQQQVLAPITKAYVAELTKTMNKTSIELQAELDAAIKREAEAATVKARREKLDYGINLAAATSELLQMLKVNGSTPSAALASFRKELQPLAVEFGAKIVLIGNGGTATLVQR
jgi:hypothetical protein